VLDSLKKSGAVFGKNQGKPDIVLSKDQALMYLEQRFHSRTWKDKNDPLRQAFGRLIYEAAHPPFDSLKDILAKYPYDSLCIPRDKFFIWDSLRVKIPVSSKSEVSKGFNSVVKIDSDTIAIKRDSLEKKPIEIIKSSDILKSVSELKDTTIMVIIDTLNEVNSSYSGFPFLNFNFPYQGDSIKVAVRSLLNYLNDRDSMVISFTGIGKSITPIMMNSKSERVMRYWLKNEFSDSVTIWIGNPSKNTIGLYLEQGVNFRRPVRQEKFINAKVTVKSLDNSKLLDIRNIAVRQYYWKYRNESSFVLNQASLSNWVKGGESSISTALDMTEYADFNNKKLKISSNNFARLTFGYIATGKDGIRKNLDLLETNSKFNHKAFGKFDFSAILLFKTQIARGKNYFKTVAGNDTSNLVSKFMNPATLTIGFGLDFKPNKTTSINFSPLSYKGTFVIDTVHIDQTQYGIAKNRKSLNEPGVSFMITNEFKPIKTVAIVNRLQLFTNYIHKPQNVDVDWEMITTAKINWFTDVRFNIHLIFDDDTRTDEHNENGQPVLNIDGTPKKTARIQFKEMMGFALSFRF
jgi:acyl dehydratase